MSKPKQLQARLLFLTETLNNPVDVKDSDLLQWQRELEYMINSNKLPGYREQTAIHLLGKIKTMIAQRKEIILQIDYAG